MKKLLGFLCSVALIGFIFITISGSTAYAVPIDLNDWTEESYTPGAADWDVAVDGSFVTQNNNVQSPTIFYSDFDAFNSETIGKIRVNTGSDDDYIGFVFGFNPGETTATTADYLLVDWKQYSQSYDFGAGPGGTAHRGLAASRVFGTPTANEFWQHANLTGSDASSGLTELARGTTLGNTGWADYATYEFDFIYTPTNLKVFVGGTLELDIAGSFNNGRLGFYNFSQGGVTYSSFTVDPVPEPTTMLLLGTGLLGLAGARRKMKK